MALLWRLLMAHFLGDFTFQSEWFFKHKNKTLARVYHGLLVGAITLLISLPYMEFHGSVNLPLILLLITITITHIGIDILKLKLTLAKNRETLLLFLTDQALHLTIIYVGFSLLPPQTYHEPYIVLKLLTFIFFTLWVTPIIVRIIDAEFKKTYIQPYTYFREKWRGLSLYERGCLFIGAGFMGYYLLLLPLAVLPRLFMKANYHETEIPLKNWLFSLAFGLIYLLSTTGVNG